MLGLEQLIKFVHFVYRICNSIFCTKSMSEQKDILKCHVQTNTIYDKTFKWETYTVHQQYLLCRENFCSLLITTYFSVLIMKQEKFQW